MKKIHFYSLAFLLITMFMLIFGITAVIAAKDKNKTTNTSAGTSTTTRTSTSTTPSTTSSKSPTSTQIPTTATSTTQNNTTTTPSSNTGSNTPNTSTTPSDDATLADLKVNRVSVADFSPSQFTYAITLAQDTLDVPTIDAITNDPAASATVIPAQQIDVLGDLPSGGNQTVIQVIAQDGREEDYVVAFYIPPAASSSDNSNQDNSTAQDNVTSNSDASLSTVSDATLKDLALDGKTIDGFDSNIFNYSVNIPKNAKKIPIVSAKANDRNAMVTIFQDTTLPEKKNNQRIAAVEVTSEDSDTTLNYVINFLSSTPAIISHEAPSNTAMITTPSPNDTFCYDFNYNFGERSRGSEVEALHTVLQREGLSYQYDQENNYGYGTERAVREFQRMYLQDYLDSIDQSNGTGYIGNKTRETLNASYSCTP